MELLYEQVVTVRSLLSSPITDPEPRKGCMICMIGMDPSKLKKRNQAFLDAAGAGGMGNQVELIEGDPGEVKSIKLWPSHDRIPV